MRAALVLGAVLAMAGCASSPAVQTAHGYPSLREVPTGGTSATTDPRHWAAIEADLLAARATVQANPRSEHTEVVDDTQEFLDEARREVEETRNSHNPY